MSGFLSEQAPVGARPALDVAASPDLPHLQPDDWPGEVLAADELLDALPAHAEHVGDLGRADEVMHDSNHSHDATSHLTSDARTSNTRHVTSSIGYVLVHAKTAGRRGLVHIAVSGDTKTLCGAHASWVTLTGRVDQATCRSCRYLHRQAEQQEGR